MKELLGRMGGRGIFIFAEETGRLSSIGVGAFQIFSRCRCRRFGRLIVVTFGLNIFLDVVCCLLFRFFDFLRARYGTGCLSLHSPMLSLSKCMYEKPCSSSSVYDTTRGHFNTAAIPRSQSEVFVAAIPLPLPSHRLLKHFLFSTKTPRVSAFCVLHLQLQTQLRLQLLTSEAIGEIGIFVGVLDILSFNIYYILAM